MYKTIKRLFVESNQIKRIIYLSCLYVILGLLGFLVSLYIGKVTQSTMSSELGVMIQDLVVLSIISIIFVLLTWYTKVLLAKTKQKMMAHFRVKTATSLVESNYEMTHSLEQGDLIGRMSNDTSSISTASSFVLEVIKSVIFLIVITIGIFVLDNRLAFTFLATLPFVFLLQYYSSSKSLKNIIPWKMAMGKVNATAQDLLNNRSTIKAFNLYDTAQGWLHEDLKDSADKGIKGIGTMYLFGSLSIIVNLIPMFVVGLVGLRYLQANLMELGTLITIIFLTTTANEEIQNMQNMTQNIPQLIASTTRIFPIWDASKEQSGNIKEASNDIAIEFEDVYFAYPSKPDHTVLNGLSFKIEKGERVGIVGTSGSGKSTIYRLLTKFYNPTNGNTFVEGVSTSLWNTSALREKFGVISQNTYLFDTSIEENLRYAHKDASNEEMLGVLDKAQLKTFTDKEGLGYIVGERGSKLSGGQRQRLSIARALLQDADIYLLDEATSALDNQTEKEIKDILFDLKDKTQVVVAHRLSTITDMDRILVLDQGRVVETGTHDSLVELDGIYAALYRKETKENE